MPEIFNWLITPISGSHTHQVEVWVSWHARIMVLAWGIVLPLGVVVARYFKVTLTQDWPRVKDNKFWWHLHRILQYSGVILMLVATAIAWMHSSASDVPGPWHARLGWLAICLGVIQIATGLLRGSKGGPTDGAMQGDHYDMTSRRVMFEWIHKLGGYAAVVAACAAIILGLDTADAPRWMWLVIGGWWGILVIAIIHLQRQGRCIDTYQAIWGPDTGTPASRKKPIGFGISRYTEQEWHQKIKSHH